MVVEHSRISLHDFVTTMEIKLKKFTEYCLLRAKEPHEDFPLFRESVSNKHASWDEEFKNFVTPKTSTQQKQNGGNH